MLVDMVTTSPDAIRAASALPDADYADLFTVDAPGAGARSPEEWARRVLEQAPVARDNARRFWRMLGLRLGPPGSPDHVQGWRIAARGEGWIRLETASWYLRAQAVCLVEDDRVSMSLSLRYRHPRAVGHVVWALIERPHRRALPLMLRQAAAL
jgi:hypothetical protein